jgi:hypothetical protein
LLVAYDKVLVKGLGADINGRSQQLHTISEHQEKWVGRGLPIQPSSQKNGWTDHQQDAMHGQVVIQPSSARDKSAAQIERLHRAPDNNKVNFEQK